MINIVSCKILHIEEIEASKRFENKWLIILLTLLSKWSCFLLSLTPQGDRRSVWTNIKSQSLRFSSWSESAAYLLWPCSLEESCWNKCLIKLRMAELGSGLGVCHQSDFHLVLPLKISFPAEAFQNQIPTNHWWHKKMLTILHNNIVFKCLFRGWSYLDSICITYIQIKYLR